MQQYAYHYKWLQHYHLSRWKLSNNISAATKAPTQDPMECKTLHSWDELLKILRLVRIVRCWNEVHGNRTLSGCMFHHTVAPTKEHRSAQKRGGYYQGRAAHKNVPQPVCCIGNATWQWRQVNFLHDQLIEGLESCLKFETLQSYSVNMYELWGPNISALLSSKRLMHLDTT